MGVKAANNLGKINESTVDQNKFVATAKAIQPLDGGGGLCGAGEWHGTFTWRVEGREQENEEGDETDVSRFRARDVETESGSQEVQAIWGKVSRRFVVCRCR